MTGPHAKHWRNTHYGRPRADLGRTDALERLGMKFSTCATPSTLLGREPANSKSSLDGSSNLGAGGWFRRRVASSRLNVSSFSESGSLLST